VVIEKDNNEIRACKIIEKIQAFKEDGETTQTSIYQLVENIGAFVEHQNH